MPWLLVVLAVLGCPSTTKVSLRLLPFDACWRCWNWSWRLVGLPRRVETFPDTGLACFRIALSWKYQGSNVFTNSLSTNIWAFRIKTLMRTFFLYFSNIVTMTSSVKISPMKHLKMSHPRKNRVTWSTKKNWLRPLRIITYKIIWGVIIWQTSSTTKICPII